MADPLPEPPAAADGGPPLLSGTLHVYVAFDWGDEMDLDHARRLVPSALRELSRRRRTPTSIAYRPPPLFVSLPLVTLTMPELGAIQALVGVTLFDFAAVSTHLSILFQLPPDGLRRLADCLAEPTAVVDTARAALRPLHERLLPAIKGPQWQTDLSEEYFVFQLPPGPPLPSPASRLANAEGDWPAWLANLLRLESGPFSPEEVGEALRLHLSYTPDDLFLADWAAAVLLDRDCDETLQAIEFANLQLLEFRNIDNRLDDSLAAAARLLRPPTRSWLPFRRPYEQPLRLLGELEVEANGLFERTSNVLKLVGDQYLARVYRLVALRFHLETWEQDIQRKLKVAEGAYQVVSDQASEMRTEFLELVVVFLILLEVLLAIFHR